MADPLYELLIPYFDALDTAARPLVSDTTVAGYLTRLSTISLSDLSSTEPSSLAHSSQSLLRSLQALSKRSHKSIISANSHTSSLASTLPRLYQSAAALQDTIPSLESSTASFASKYRRPTSDEDVPDDPLAHRKKALLLSQNADRISSILDLPTLLSSSISSSTQSTEPAHTKASTAAPPATSSAMNYASALDLHAHIKRLRTLYPDSPLIESISTQATHEMRLLTTQLIANLQGPGLKLASAMRTIGWLRRMAPELDSQFGSSQKGGTSTTWQKRPIAAGGSGFGSTDGALGALFLACRLKSLVIMLEALEPLRELADHETQSRLSSDTGQRLTKGFASAGVSTTGGSTGQQTERYLKRYIEIFREQSFAILSTYRSIFPSALPVPGSTATAPDVLKSPTFTTSPTLSNDRLAREDGNTESAENGLLPIPSPLATFPTHLVDMLLDTLMTYLPNVRDKAARESLLTQVLYCAGSMGRLGGDFGLITALLRSEAEDDGDEDVEEEEEWVEVMRKHRVQASRLELLASGVGVGTARGISVPLRKESEVT